MSNVRPQRREGVLTSSLTKDLKWHKSSKCEGGACIETAAQENAILLRNSADPDGTILVVTPAAWRDLIASVKQA